MRKCVIPFVCFEHKAMEERAAERERLKRAREEKRRKEEEEKLVCFFHSLFCDEECFAIEE